MIQEPRVIPALRASFVKMGSKLLVFPVHTALAELVVVQFALLVTSAQVLITIGRFRVALGNILSVVPHPVQIAQQVINVHLQHKQTALH